MNEFKPTNTDKMRFELYEWFTQEVLEDALWKKYRHDEMADVCNRLGNEFEDQLNKMSCECLEDLYYDTFPETDIDNGGMLCPE